MTIVMRYGLLADYATVGAGKKLTIVHTFEHFRPPPERIGQPIAMGFLVARIEGSIVDAGNHVLRIKVHDGDENPLPMEIVLEEFALGITGPGLPLAAQLLLPLGPVPMPEIGEYEFVLTADGQEVGRVPFHVLGAVPASGE
jgi:hypothetical protein